MSSSAKEIDFGSIKNAEATIKQWVQFVMNHEKWWVFVLVNIVMYGIFVWLAIFRLFDLV